LYLRKNNHCEQREHVYEDTHEQHGRNKCRVHSYGAMFLGRGYYEFLGCIKLASAGQLPLGRPRRLERST